jgi:hypothetical protein
MSNIDTDIKPEEPGEDQAGYEEGSDMPGYADLKELFEQVFGSYGEYPDGVSAEYLEERLGEDFEYDYETTRAALEEVLDEYGVPEEHRQPMYDAIEAHDGYGAEALAEGLTIEITNTEVNNYIDNSIKTGDYAEIYQENESNVATASAEGATAVGDDLEGEVITQTGDGVQAGEADNIQTGDDNVAGSDHASRVSAGDQISTDGAHVDDSNFGDGTNQANQLHDSQNELDVNLESSFTNDESYTDDDHLEVGVVVDTTENGYLVEDYEEPQHHEVPEHHEPYVEVDEEPHDEAEPYENELDD